MDSMYMQFPFSPDEIILGEWTAGRIMHRVSAQGGKIFLTNSHLIFTPIKINLPFAIGKTIGEALGLNNTVFDVIGKIRDIMEKIVSVPLDQVERIEAVGQPSLLTPPTVVVTLRDLSHYQFGFLAGIWSPNFDPKNARVRDDFFQQLQAILR